MDPTRSPSPNSMFPVQTTSSPSPPLSPKESTLEEDMNALDRRIEEIKSTRFVSGSGVYHPYLTRPPGKDLRHSWDSDDEIE